MEAGVATRREERHSEEGDAKTESESESESESEVWLS